MTGETPTDIGMTCRYGMTLVRLRDGVLPAGQPVPADHSSPGRAPVTHVVRGEVVVGLGSAVNAEPVTACCGLVFASRTVELVAWGTAWPHEVCVRKTGYAHSFMSRVYRDANDATRRLAASNKDFEASTALLGKVVAARDRDWVQDDDGNAWTYEASFNGVLADDRLYPRGRDIGLERLTVAVPYPGMVHIHACGVRDGCSRHLARTETFSLSDIDAVEKRLASHEIAATSIALSELTWCLIVGDCSRTAVYEPNDPAP